MVEEIFIEEVGHLKEEIEVVAEVDLVKKDVNTEVQDLEMEEKVVASGIGLVQEVSHQEIVNLNQKAEAMRNIHNHRNFHKNRGLDLYHQEVTVEMVLVLLETNLKSV